MIDANGRGFGATQATFFRFDAALDPTTLPDAACSLVDGASVFLVDVTAGAHLGEKVPVRLRFEPTKGDYIGTNWLAVQPVPGYAPREGETYAAIVTDAVKGPNGKAALPAASLSRVLHAAPQGDAETRAFTAYAPLAAWLAAQPARTDGSLLVDHVAAASVYTTQKGTALMDALRTAVNAFPQPVIGNLVHAKSTTRYDEFTGTYDSPNFQAGDPPYTMTGGQITWANGVPQVVRTESLRVAMTIPKGTMPDGGWPIILVAHGTGGDYQTFIDDGTAGRFSIVTDKAGTELARFALISIDQVLHGPRAPAGTDVETAFFNFENILAARDNPKQGALDDFQLMRLVQTLDVAAAPETGQHIVFDKTRHYFFGHSQGSLTGSLYVGSEPDLSAAIFSGAGAGLVPALLYKTQPVNIAGLVQTLFRDTVDDFHPFLNLLQGYFDESDPASYARRYFVDPPAGFAAKSVYVSLGVGDSYAPDQTIEAFALDTGVLPVAPQLLAIDGLGLDGRRFVDAPQALNVGGSIAAHTATGVLCEYEPAANDDGHFVVFDVPDAQAQSTRFFGTHAATGTARLDAP